VEEGFIARALSYRWPPNSWDHLTIARLVRIYGIEQQLAEQRQSESETPPTAPPMRTGSDMAEDDED
jgi:hypothetical protein